MMWALAMLFAFFAPAAAPQKHLTTTDIALWVVAGVLFILILARRRARKTRDDSRVGKPAGR